MAGSDNAKHRQVLHLTRSPPRPLRYFSSGKVIKHVSCRASKEPAACDRRAGTLEVVLYIEPR